MKTDVYNLKNEKVGTADLPDAVFGVAWKPALVKQVITAMQANLRRPWAHVKDRSEVRGGGRKPWRQKGTGRARHGSIRSPLWSGGGKAHGPRNERDYSQKVNAKMKRLALLSVLSKKFKENEVRVVDSFVLAEPKTKMIATDLRTVLGVAKKAKKYDALLVPEPENKNIFRAVRNLPKTKALHAASLNVYDAMNHKQILIARDAITVLAERAAS